jgi:hypothetical protein
MLYVFHSPFVPFESTRVTVVGNYNEGILKIAVARNGKKDNFCRKTGRLIAVGRLLKEKLFVSLPIIDEMSNEIFIRTASLVARFVDYTKKIQLTEKESDDLLPIFLDMIEEIKEDIKKRKEIECNASATLD